MLQKNYDQLETISISFCLFRWFQRNPFYRNVLAYTIFLFSELSTLSFEVSGQAINPICVISPLSWSLECRQQGGTEGDGGGDAAGAGVAALA
jgi:hypothetical protein